MWSVFVLTKFLQDLFYFSCSSVKALDYKQ